jgi:hypothetical protein
MFSSEKKNMLPMHFGISLEGFMRVSFVFFKFWIKFWVYYLSNISLNMDFVVSSHDC